MENENMDGLLAELQRESQSKQARVDALEAEVMELLSAKLELRQRLALSETAEASENDEKEG